MAARFSIGDGVVGRQFTYANLTVVGRGADNKKIDDIQLVQVFLHDFFTAETELFNKVSKPPRGASKGILIDGIVGPQTISAITTFQRFQRDSNGTAVIEGRVSVPRLGAVIPGTKTPFAITLLNEFFSPPIQIWRSTRTWKTTRC